MAGEDRKYGHSSGQGADHAGESEVYALIRECIAGSRQAQRQLYDQYAPTAFAIIRRYVYNNEVLAEEILNDAFYKVLTRIEQYSFQGPFGGWVRRIVVNTITDHMRKSINHEQHKEVKPEDASVDGEPVGRMAYKELLELIHGLPDVQRTVFNLFVIENYAHKEIGGMLGITENNCRWYLNDARKRLREKIKFLSNR